MNVVTVNLAAPSSFSRLITVVTAEARKVKVKMRFNPCNPCCVEDECCDWLHFYFCLTDVAPGVAGNFLLLEDGTNILLENGEPIEIE